MRTKIRALAALATLGGLAILAGCGTANAATGQGVGSTIQVSAAPSTPPATVAIAAPASGATNIPTSSEIVFTGAASAAAAVTLADSSGAAVGGSMRSDGSAWVPASQLKYGTIYTATVNGASAVTFTTMNRPGRTVNVSTSIADGQTYGVGMPIVVNFGSNVAADQRANVERRLLVTSEPAQVGSWFWFNGQEVHYRPKDYWQEGTTLAIRLATGGLSFGGNGYGARDVTVHASIGDKILMTTDNATKTMTVTRRDEVLKTIPISLGKASTPSSSGSMVVMTKARSELFVSTDPEDPYRETVYWTQRLTSSGQYIHAAPWSVGSQGRRNVSHGCTNMSTDNAKWLFGITHVGDPVVVKGTPRKLDWGNGWTDWDRSWTDYLKGSALPAPTAG
jgi:lipoprotein-anchoring transpeptidase ErfK/SrfK